MNSNRVQYSTLNNDPANREKPVHRLPQLDLLRGLAVLLVLGAHPVAKLDESGWFLAHRLSVELRGMDGR